MIAGDQNADPFDGDSADDAILTSCCDHPRINASSPPDSRGRPPRRRLLQGGANLTHEGDPPRSTPRTSRTEGRRATCASTSCCRRRGRGRSLGSGIFWPVDADPLYRLTGDYDPTRWPFTGVPTSDHRQVWVDLRF